MIKMARLYALQKADMRALEKQGVRENPIRRGGYSGGAAPTLLPQYGLASRRAAEIQAKHQTTDSNGATPSMGVSRMRGGRAVPSSGLSQFRGGAMERMVGAGHGSECDSDSSEEYEGGARIGEILARESGRRPAIRSGQSKEHSAEAKEMGHHLGKHLISVRGSGFFNLFQKGVAEAGQSGDSIAEKTDMPNPNDTAESVPTTTEPPKSGSGFFDQFKQHKKPDVSMKPIYVGGPDYLGDNMKLSSPFFKKQVGKGKLTIIHGGYLSGAYEGMGAGEDEEFQRRNAAEQRKKMAKMPFLPLATGAGSPEENAKWAKERSNRLAKKKYEAMAAESRLTPAQKAARAKQQAELLEKTKNHHGSTEEEKRGSYGRRSTGMGVGCGEVGEIRGNIGDLLKGKKITMIGKARRAPAGPSDGRRKRAEIVKKVMAEKGCSMIEASKYVKAHGLY